MPLTLNEKTQLQSDAQNLADHIAALTVDPDPNPLQVALDQANAALAAANGTIATLQGKIDAAKASIAAANAADATEDAARAEALAHLS